MDENASEEQRRTIDDKIAPSKRPTTSSSTKPADTIHSSDTPSIQQVPRQFLQLSRPIRSRIIGVGLGGPKGNWEPDGDGITKGGQDSSCDGRHH